MSKLKTAKAIRKSFTIAGAVLKWGGLAALGALIIGLLWAWANAHFISFAIVMGIIAAVLLLSACLALLDWSDDVIKEAEKEERRAQERNRVEKDRRENPDVYTPRFDASGPQGYGAYR